MPAGNQLNVKEFHFFALRSQIACYSLLFLFDQCKNSGSPKGDARVEREAIFAGASISLPCAELFYVPNNLYPQRNLIIVNEPLQHETSYFHFAASLYRHQRNFLSRRLRFPFVRFETKTFSLGRPLTLGSVYGFPIWTKCVDPKKIEKARRKQSRKGRKIDSSLSFKSLPLVLLLSMKVHAIRDATSAR